MLSKSHVFKNLMQESNMENPAPTYLVVKIVSEKLVPTQTFFPHILIVCRIACIAQHGAPTDP